MMSNATMPQARIARVATPAVCIKGLKTYTRQCFNNRHQSAERFRVEPAGSNNPRHRPVLERMSLFESFGSHFESVDCVLILPTKIVQNVEVETALPAYCNNGHTTSNALDVLAFQDSKIHCECAVL